MTGIVGIEIMYLVGSEWLTWIIAFGLLFTAMEYLYWQCYVQYDQNIVIPIIFHPTVVIAKLTALVA